MNNRGSTVFGTLLVLIIIGIMLVGAITYVQKAKRVIKEYAMISELSNFRTSILMYFIINKKFPESLTQMVEEKVIVPFRDRGAIDKVKDLNKGISLQPGSMIIDRTYLEKISIDSEGRIFDPFGKPYLYDKEQGRVKSSTSGYEGF